MLYNFTIYIFRFLFVKSTAKLNASSRIDYTYSRNALHEFYIKVSVREYTPSMMPGRRRYVHKCNVDRFGGFSVHWKRFFVSLFFRSFFELQPVAPVI